MAFASCTIAAMAQSSAAYSSDEEVFVSTISADTPTGSEIQIRAKQLAGENILLAYYYFGQVYVKDSLQLDSKGKGTFKSKEKYPQGLYAICVKRAPVLDLILGGDQTMTVKIDTTAHYENITVEGSAESADFNGYAQYMKRLQRSSKEKNEEIKALKDSAEIDKIKAELRLMGVAMTEKQNALIAKYPKSMCGIFIKGTWRW